MADYFTNFSLILKLDAEQKRYALELAKKAAEHQYQDEPVPDGFPVSLAEVLEDWHFDTEPEDSGIWLHSQNGGIDAVCAFIQHLLQQFNLPGAVMFEWSHDCSQLRTDAFGGGAAYITAHEIKTFNTSDWLRSLAA